MAPLTTDQIAIVQGTWEIPNSNPLDSGEAILFRFFEKYPANIQKFQSFKNTPLLSLKGTPGFRNHAGKIMKVFDEAISALDKPNYAEVLQDVWGKIAVSHARRKITKQSFNELREVILEVLTAACNLDATQQAAWSNLMDNVYHIIFTVLDQSN